jgi:hypothetical protein
MVSRRLAAALVLAQLSAGAALAQSAEFGRASGGEITAITKGATAPFSGSLGLSMGSDVFGRREGYEATIGGTLIQDRLWFFAAGSQQSGGAYNFADLQLPERAVTGAIDAKLDGQLGSAHDFSASYRMAQTPVLTMTGTPLTVPTNFLSLRYSAVVTNNMTFSASYWRNE